MLLCSLAPGLAGQTFADTEKRIAAWAAQHSDVLRLSTAGTSAGGRKIHAIEIAAAGPVPPAQRPAVFVGANIAGYHHAGTEAAMRLVERLVARKTDPLLQKRTFYILPLLNPDAANATRVRNHLNGAKLDRDRDGLVGEDGPNDLNGDGRITQMRIPDPHGEYVIDPADPRLMKKADPLKGEKGAYRLLTEGDDDDRDGQYNEDPSGGFAPDKNFAMGWADNDPEAGPFPSSTPEAKAAMDYLLARRNVAVAFVFGPANNLLEIPKGAGAEFGQTRLLLTPAQANMLSVEPRAYTVDELFALVERAPAIQQMGGSREAMAAALQAGPATAPDGEDIRYYQSFSDDYKKILEKAGLDVKRPGKASPGGGFQQWLYYHYAAFAVELDIWGAAKPGDAALLAWTPIQIAGGKAEIGGLDAAAEITPPAADLPKAVDAHADAVLLAAEKLARVEILSTEVKELSAGLYRVTATAANTGLWPTHTKHAIRARTWLPVRLKLTLPSGATLVSGRDQAVAERLTGGTGTLKGEWLVQGTRGMRCALDVLSQNAGTDRREVVLQ